MSGGGASECRMLLGEGGGSRTGREAGEAGGLVRLTRCRQDVGPDGPSAVSRCSRRDC